MAADQHSPWKKQTTSGAWTRIQIPKGCMWFPPDLTQNLNYRMHIFWLEQNNLLSELWKLENNTDIRQITGFQSASVLYDIHLQTQTGHVLGDCNLYFGNVVEHFMELVSRRLRNSIPDIAGQLDTLWHVPDSVDSRLESPFLFFQYAHAMELASVRARNTPGRINRAAPNMEGSRTGQKLTSLIEWIQHTIRSWFRDTCVKWSTARD